MTIHQEINAHLLAADRNPLKRAQHLLSATQHAESAGVAHFGRWSESSIHARNAVIEHREQERRIKSGERRGQEGSTEQRGAAPGASAPAQPTTIGKAAGR